MNGRRLMLLVASFLVFCAFIYGWKLMTDARLVSPVFLPGPERVWLALSKGFADGVLQVKWLGTVERMIYGWLLASLAGVLLGAVIGSSEIARDYFQPFLELMRPLPASAIVPIAIVLMGLTETMVLSVIAFGALWPMLLATVHGFSTVDPRLKEVARLLQMSRLDYVRKIALPNSMPDILTGMRLGLTVALILSVVGEMLASREGLGNWVLLAARSFRSADLYAGVILLGITGYISAILLTLVERRFLRWQVRH